MLRDDEGIEATFSIFTGPPLWILHQRSLFPSVHVSAFVLALPTVWYVVLLAAAYTPDCWCTEPLPHKQNYWSTCHNMYLSGLYLLRATVLHDAFCALFLFLSFSPPPLFLPVYEYIFLPVIVLPLLLTSLLSTSPYFPLVQYIC